MVHSVASKRLEIIRPELKWQDFCYNIRFVVTEVYFFAFRDILGYIVPFMHSISFAIPEHNLT